MYIVMVDLSRSPGIPSSLILLPMSVCALLFCLLVLPKLLTGHCIFHYLDLGFDPLHWLACELSQVL